MVADAAGIPVIPILVEGSQWGKEGRRFPDLLVDVPETLPVEGNKTIAPREVMSRVFQGVAIELSRTYFDAFLARLSKRIESEAVDGVGFGVGNNKNLTASVIDVAATFWVTHFGAECEVADWYVAAWLCSFGGEDACR